MKVIKNFKDCRKGDYIVWVKHSSDNDDVKIERPLYRCIDKVDSNNKKKNISVSHIFSLYPKEDYDNYDRDYNDSVWRVYLLNRKRLDSEIAKAKKLIEYSNMFEDKKNEEN